jgi:hypothetical protein
LISKNLAPDSRGSFNSSFFDIFQNFYFALGKLTQESTAIRAVTLTRRIVVGTRGGETCEIEKDGRIRVPIQGLNI